MVNYPVHLHVTATLIKIPFWSYTSPPFPPESVPHPSQVPYYDPCTIKTLQPFRTSKFPVSSPAPGELGPGLLHFTHRAQLRTCLLRPQETGVEARTSGVNLGPVLFQIGEAFSCSPGLGVNSSRTWTA